MRDLEQCKAEIFRRSEEKIKERARMRRRALTLCLPLVLCLVVGAVAWPALTGNAMKNAPGVVEENGDLSYAGEMTWEDPALVDHSQETAIRLEDAPAAAELLRGLGTEDNSEGKNRLTNGGKQSQSKQEQTDASSASVISGFYEYGDEEWQITLTGPDGTTEVYALQGNTLTCETGEWQRELDDEELVLVHKVLGLPE